MRLEEYLGYRSEPLVPHLGLESTLRENIQPRYGIPLLMNGRKACLLFAVCVVLMFSAFPAEGMFQGKLVAPPAGEHATPGWIFVQGRNHAVRRVDVSRATIVGSGASSSKKCGPECLAIGQEVRVTAEQDGSGEWRATRVEVVRSADRQS